MWRHHNCNVQSTWKKVLKCQFAFEVGLYINEHSDLCVNAFTDYKRHTQYNTARIIIFSIFKLWDADPSSSLKWCHWVIRTFFSSHPALGKYVPQRLHPFSNPQFYVLYVTYHLLLSNISFFVYQQRSHYKKIGRNSISRRKLVVFTFCYL